MTKAELLKHLEGLIDQDARVKHLEDTLRRIKALWMSRRSGNLSNELLYANLSDIFKELKRSSSDVGHNISVGDFIQVWTQLYEGMPSVITSRSSESTRVFARVVKKTQKTLVICLENREKRRVRLSQLARHNITVVTDSNLLQQAQRAVMAFCTCRKHIKRYSWNADCSNCGFLLRNRQPKGAHEEGLPLASRTNGCFVRLPLGSVSDLPKAFGTNLKKMRLRRHKRIEKF